MCVYVHTQRDMHTHICAYIFRLWLSFNFLPDIFEDYSWFCLTQGCKYLLCFLLHFWKPILCSDLFWAHFRIVWQFLKVHLTNLSCRLPFLPWKFIPGAQFFAFCWPMSRVLGRLPSLCPVAMVLSPQLSGLWQQRLPSRIAVLPHRSICPPHASTAVSELW